MSWLDPLVALAVVAIYALLVYAGWRLWRWIVRRTVREAEQERRRQAERDDIYGGRREAFYTGSRRRQRERRR